MNECDIRYAKALEYARDLLDKTADDYVCKNMTKKDIMNLLGRILPEIADKNEEMRLSIIEILKSNGTVFKDELDWMKKLKPFSWTKDDEENLENIKFILNDPKLKEQYSMPGIIKWLNELKFKINNRY